MREAFFIMIKNCEEQNAKWNTPMKPYGLRKTIEWIPFRPTIKQNFCVFVTFEETLCVTNRYSKELYRYIKLIEGFVGVIANALRKNISISDELIKSKGLQGQQHI